MDNQKKSITPNNCRAAILICGAISASLPLYTLLLDFTEFLEQVTPLLTQHSGPLMPVHTAGWSVRDTEIASEHAEQDQGCAEVQSTVCIQLYLQATNNGGVKVTAFPTLKADLAGL